MTFFPNEVTPYISKIQQKFDEAQKFLVKNGFHKTTKGLLQDIENANDIDKKRTNNPHTMDSKTIKSLGRQLK